jgi:hypothetical protein
MRTDKGQEFRARTVQFVLKEAGIKHFYAQNEVKASVAERVIKTIKTKIYIYLYFISNFKLENKFFSTFIVIRLCKVG